MNELELKIARMRAALDALAERDLSSFGAVEFPGGIGIKFSETLSPAELSNAVHDAIHAIAHLRDHFKRAARAAGLGKNAVTRVIEGSLALQVVIDLSNTDKHGPDGRGGHSRRSPWILKMGRALSQSVGPGDTVSSVIFKFDGSPPVVQSGNAEVRVTATVADKDCNEIGELEVILNDAMNAWGELLKRIRDATAAESSNGSESS